MTRQCRLAVVVPVYHNAPSLPTLHRRLTALEDAANVQVEIIYVDDRSGDDSYAVLQSIVESDPRARVIRLARNFGSFIAIRAGLDQVADADCVAVISADLQDPPEHLTAMLDAWRRGNQVVLATRRSRADGWCTRLTSAVGHLALRRVAFADLPAGGFDFFLVDRQVAALLCRLPEQNTSLIGLVLWLGFRRAVLPYDRKRRPFGRSQWRMAAKLRYFVDSLVAFSGLPLRMASLLGILVLLLTVPAGIWLACQSTILSQPVTPWTVLMTIVGFLGGAQLLSVGILGEYLWRNLQESRQRPLYIIDHSDQFGADQAHVYPAATRRYSKAQAR